MFSVHIWEDCSVSNITSRSGGASGFGLGLNYVLRIMEAHGGRVTLESMEGEYSRFTLVFPPESALENKKEEQ